MFKKMLVVMGLLIVVTVSGCQTVEGILADTEGTARALRKHVRPMADKATQRDNELAAKDLQRYHASQAGIYASFNRSEQE